MPPSMRGMAETTAVRYVLRTSTRRLRPSLPAERPYLLEAAIQKAVGMTE